MNLLETVLKAGGGSLVKQLAESFGLEEAQAEGATRQLIPALSRSVQKQGSSAAGLLGLLGALGSATDGKFLDDPSLLRNSEAEAEGNNILGHLFGSKDVSRNVAAHAAKETGIDGSVLKKMLPVLATVVVSAIGKQALANNITNEQSADQSGLNAISSFLDADKDGSIVDDVLGLAQRLF